MGTPDPPATILKILLHNFFVLRLNNYFSLMVFPSFGHHFARYFYLDSTSLSYTVTTYLPLASFVSVLLHSLLCTILYSSVSSSGNLGRTTPSNRLITTVEQKCDYSGFSCVYATSFALFTWNCASPESAESKNELHQHGAHF